MRKNIIKLLAILAMCFMVVCVLASCNNNEQPATNDNNQNQESVDLEMYIKDGTYWVGDFNTGLPADGGRQELCPSHDDPDHEWHHECIVREHDQNGTPDIVFYGCLDCNYAFTVETGHIFDTYVETVAVTCTTNGYDVYKCRCGLTENRNIVPALGHDYSEKVGTTPVTCTTDGFTTYKCRCGLTENREIKAALGHDFPVWNASWTHETVDTTVWTALTTIGANDCPCEFVGQYDAKCTRCDVRTDVKETVKVEHAYTDYRFAVPDITLSPCLQATYKVAKCDHCYNGTHDTCKNHAKYVEVEGKPGHEYTEWIVVGNDPTETTGATIVRSCTRPGCNTPSTVEDFNGVLPALSEANGWTLTVEEASCVKTGLKTYTMKKDDTTFTFTVVIDADGGHQINKATPVVVAPTTTEVGSVKVVCPDCGAELEYVLAKIPTADAYRTGETAGYTIVPGTCADPTVTFKLVITDDDFYTGHSINIEFSIKDQAYHPHAVSTELSECIIAKDEFGNKAWFGLCTGSTGCEQWIYLRPWDPNIDEN